MEISRKIIDYTIWYYLKYYPSPKKLKQKLNEKFWPNSPNWENYWWINSEEIEYILNEKLRNIITEEEVIKSKIRIYKDKWKSKLYIKQKLFSRQEDKELSEIFLNEAFLYWELDNIKIELEKIKSKLTKKSFSNDFELKQKIIQKLMSKWFKYDDIKMILN